MNEKSIESLRAEFDAAAKAGSNTTSYVEAIALRYILEEYNYSYNKMNLNAYIRDYIDRNVSAAEEYCIRGLADSNLIESPDRYFNYPSLNGEKQAKLRALFAAAKSRVQPPEDLDALSMHYLEMEDDPQRIVYNEVHLFKYLQDWLRGVHFAEKHIKRASRENLDFFLDVVERGSKGFLGRGKEFSDEQKRKIYALVTEFLPSQNELLKKLEILSLKQAILEAKKPGECASLLVIILTKNYTTAVLGDGITLNECSSKVLDTSAFCYLDDQEQFTTFCDHFKGPNQKLVAAKIYGFTLDALGQFPKGVERLKAIVERGKASSAQSLPVKPKAVFDISRAALVQARVNNEEEISIPFYYASLKKDVQMLLDVGYRNGKEFHQLLMSEFRLLTEATYSGPLDTRTQFYQDLMAQGDMRNLRTFEKLKEALVQAYKAKNLAIPSLPVITHGKVEARKDGQTTANIQYEKSTETSGLLSWLSSSKKPADEEDQRGSSYKPDL